jgi:hypothetical protein
MASDVSCINSGFRLTLNFLEVDSSDFGVRACLDIEYIGRSQNLKFSIAHLWIEYAELRKFESDLMDGAEVKLHDMSDYPVLHFERGLSHESLTINPPSQRQSLDGDAVVIHLKIEAGSMQAIHSSLSQFAKWW